MIVINKSVFYMYFHKNLHGARLLGHPVYVILSCMFRPGSKKAWSWTLTTSKHCKY